MILTGRWENHPSTIRQPNSSTHFLKQIGSIMLTNHSSLPIYLSCDAFYDIKPIHNEKSTGFGHARKNTEIVRCDSPSPDRYRLKTEFDKNIDDKKGFKFGSGKRDSYIVTEQLKGYPGPGWFSGFHFWINWFW